MSKGIETIIEITDTHVKCVQSKILRSKKVISACDIRPLAQFTDDELTRALTEVVRSKHISSDQLTLVIPRRLAILKQLRLPSQNEDEINKMIGLQLVNQIPYGIDDIIFDYHLIEKEATGYVKVLVVIVHKDISNRFLKIFNKIGIPIVHLTLSSLGVLGWYMFQESQRKIREEQAAMVVNIDAAHSEICFFYNSKLLFSRSINHGAKDLAQDNIVGILSQVELSAGTYQKEDMGTALRKCSIVSALADVTRLRDSIEQRLHIPTEILTPSMNVLTQKNINLSSLKEQAGLSLAVCIGLFWGDIKRPVNLLPAQVQEDKISKLRKRQLVVFFVLFILNIFLGVSILGVELYKKTETLNALEKQIEQAKAGADKANRVLEFLKVAKEQFEERVFIPDLMRSLFQLTPKDISFRSISLDESGVFTIQGYAQTNSGVSTFQSNLVNSSVFGEINLQFATQRRIFNMDVTDFKIVCKLKK